MSEPNRIRQLDETTIGHIAAGEVVERPAQVVKELLENSLDAGATHLVITVERGGFDLIRIEDDGSGIDEQDLRLALDRHATSKLQKAEDLNSIHTLGFRGEALASIGMVSHLSISSRPEGKEGKSISMKNGEKGVVKPFGMQKGTRVDVEHLFRNTPARLAFQRRPATENARIVDVVVAHAMAHQLTGFRLLIDERVMLDIPPSESMMDRLFDLLGGQVESMLEIQSPQSDAEAPGQERWSGWISTPDITRGKGDDIHILINERPVAAGPFLQAIRRGYRTRLMQGRHPIAVLSLTLPPEEVDVNVHPTKREVRLRHSWRVLERLERSIAHTLESVPTQPDAAGGIPGLQGLGIQKVTSIQEHLTVETPSTNPLDAAAGAPALVLPKESKSEVPPAWALAAGAQLNLHGKEATEPESVEKKRPQSTAPEAQETLPGMDEKPIAPALSPAERTLHRHAGCGNRHSPNEEQPLTGIVNELPEMEPLAQFADSYILVQAEGELLLIDQHALHERIRYERLRNDESLWESQTKLEPIKLDLDARQSARMSAAINTLSEVGFTINETEQGWVVEAAPHLLEGEELVPFLLDLLQDTAEDGAPLETVDRRKDHLAFLNACRGAVKANEKLTLPEMRRLVEDMRRITNPWACVHGRPTALRLPLDSLDHHFGRHG
ncbi:MAG: DNA mismatch repair endonuclease MutL [Euryarchaeota archaeon]|nr:DNA mismatch repair endonuclease MutL [Euryarchaeota archaeon]